MSHTCRFLIMYTLEGNPGKIAGVVCCQTILPPNWYHQYSGQIKLPCSRCEEIHVLEKSSLSAIFRIFQL